MNRFTKAPFVSLALALALVVVTAGSSAADPKGFIEDELGVGFFYGTLGEHPNVVLLVAGTAEEFCEANPDDPFNAEPGVAPLRIFPRADGSVDFKVNDKGQPIHLYETDIDGAPPWIGQVCADLAAGGETPAPFASGIADLKVRLSFESEDRIDVFNSVNGVASGTDGQAYRVRAWADLVVENGIPIGDPADFVGFRLQPIGR